MVYWTSSISRVYIVPLEKAKVKKIVSLIDKLPSWCFLPSGFVMGTDAKLENLADTPTPSVNAKCELTVG